MNERKLNRIIRYIEKEGGLDTIEHESLMTMLNRLYLKRIVKAEIQAFVDDSAMKQKAYKKKS